MEEIRKFLSEPEEHQDEFWESDALIWVDWRDFDESIFDLDKAGIHRLRKGTGMRPHSLIHAAAGLQNTSPFLMIQTILTPTCLFCIGKRFSLSCLLFSHTSSLLFQQKKPALFHMPRR